MLDLPEVGAEINDALATQFCASPFATAVIAASTSTPAGCAGSTPAIPPR